MLKFTILSSGSHYSLVFQPQQLTLSAQESQLRQLQLLQEQLVQQSKILAKPALPQAPLIDSGLLTQIQTLTNQLLGETQDEKPTPTKPAFNKVSMRKNVIHVLCRVT